MTIRASNPAPGGKARNLILGVEDVCARLFGDTTPINLSEQDALRELDLTHASVEQGVSARCSQPEGGPAAQGLFLPDHSKVTAMAWEKLEGAAGRRCQYWKFQVEPTV